MHARGDGARRGLAGGQLRTPHPPRRVALHQSHIIDTSNLMGEILTSKSEAIKKLTTQQVEVAIELSKAKDELTRTRWACTQHTCACS